MEYQIQLLEKEKWQGHKAYFSDYADNCFDVMITHEENAIVRLQKVPLKERKIIKYPQHLLVSNDASVKAWGVVDNGELVAGVETSVENNAKNPRLYISLLWVNEEYRRKGIAAALIEKAKERARTEKLRAVFLQTWSCNEHAIAFYLSQGFRLIGFDSCPFSNEDIEKYNVPLKLGYFT